MAGSTLTLPGPLEPSGEKAGSAMWQRTWDLVVASSLHVACTGPWGPSGGDDLGRAHGAPRSGSSQAWNGVDGKAGAPGWRLRVEMLGYEQPLRAEKTEATTSLVQSPGTSGPHSQGAALDMSIFLYAPLCRPCLCILRVSAGPFGQERGTCTPLHRELSACI